MKKKIILAIIILVLILAIFVMIVVVNSSKDKTGVTDNVENVKEAFPNIDYIESVNIEWEVPGGLLPTPDAPYYRGYIYLSEEGKKYYKETYSWENAEPQCNLKVIDKNDFEENEWMVSSEFKEECIPNTVMGTFYFSESGIIYVEFNSN